MIKFTQLLGNSSYLAGLGLGLLLLSLQGCTRHLVAKDISLVGFQEKVTKGKSVGMIEGDDCIFSFFGNSMGGYPSVSRAIANARAQRMSKVGDVFGGKRARGGVRYINNMRIEPDGFDLGVFGKNCLVVTGMGYK